MKHIKRFNENVEQSQVGETQNYMFFANLKTIKRLVDKMLQMDESQVDQIITDGHDWASDHISTSKDDVEEVFNFLASHCVEGCECEPEEMNELNKETWMSAADKATSKGYKKLADKFREHGKQFGKSDPQKEFEMVFKKREGEVNLSHLIRLKLRLVSIKDSGWQRSFDMIAEDEDGKQYNIAVNNFGGIPKFYLDKEWDGLALNRREAKKLLDILKDNKIDVTSDSRSISYEDVGF